MNSNARNIVLLVYYFPPINSSGAKRMEAMAKFFARAGRKVTVVTPTKSAADGEFTESVPEGVALYEIDALGRRRASKAPPAQTVPYRASRRGRIMRRIKDFTMRKLGQIPDPRIPFAFSFLSPFLDKEVKAALQAADVVVGTCPPWPPLMAGLFCKWRFGVPAVMDYRDHLSMCHEMPGGRFAKNLELHLDRFLTRNASSVVTISEPMAAYYSQFHPRVTAVLNGYEPDMIENAKRTSPWSPRAPGAPLTIRYVGIVTAGRIPRALLGALVQLRREGRLPPGSVVFEYYGECGMMEEALEADFVEVRDLFKFLPRVSYQRSLELVVTADHVLFCENAIAAKPGEEASAAGILTTKLFEYLASGRPILGDINPETLAGTFARRGSDCHFLSDRSNEFREFLLSDRFWSPPTCDGNAFVRSLSRASQAEQYLVELDAVVAAHGARDRPVEGQDFRAACADVLDRQ